MPLTIGAESTPLVVKAEPQPLMFKPEPVEDRVLNRKRSGTLSILQGTVPKKVKAEPENPPVAEANVKPYPSMSTEAIRGELLDLQTEVNRLQPQLDRSRRKDEKTSSQLTRELNITSQLIALHQRMKELTEMLPAVSAPAHPIPGPSFQNSATYGLIQHRQPLASVHPSVASVTVASGSNHLAGLLSHDPMGFESDGDHVTPPPTSDMDSFPSLEDDNDRMLVDGTNFGIDFYHHNVAKADE